MQDDKRLQGRKAALELVNKINQKKNAEIGSHQALIEAISAIELPEAQDIDFTPVVEAIKELSFNVEAPVIEKIDLKPLVSALNTISFPENPDIRPLIEAIQGISFEIDVPEPAPIEVDISGIESQLNQISQSIGVISQKMDEMIRLSKRPKVVKYDQKGRIIAIQTKD